ncbi:hypothetical protein CANARDRAFT_187710, partial [[Candida] arabinofermentans NRRL YB-2248]
MSFIGGGAECAANANPLAQFNKHSQNDTSLQQSMRNQAGDLMGQNANQLRSQTMMNPEDRLQMEQFINQQNTHQTNFDFQPMANEINVIHQQQHLHNPQQQSHNMMAQEFSQMNHDTIQQSAPAKSAWSSEFRTNDQLPVNAIPHQQQQPQQPMMRNRMMMGGMGGGMMMNRMGGMRNMTTGMAPVLQSNTQQMNEVNWEESFKEVEEVATEKETEIGMESKESAFDQVWDNVQGTYADNTVSNDEFQAQWEKDFEKYAHTRLNYGEYKFEENNQFLHNTDAYEIGIKLMESGAKLSEAALAFEAAVQEDPGHIDAWLRLGQVQTQNEKELAGIAALEKTLELAPQNLSALMTLAISYVNEGYDNAAYATLERWIETKYPEVAERARIANPEIQADDRYALNKRVTELYIKAAQLSPSGANMDADIQTGLGVLFYSMEEYDKTMDCFQAAIDRNPSDALSWNRLGASLANSNRPEQAVEAYSRALHLNPNFVRARYNLGVSFINMGMYKDAVEHLLTGLTMHEVESSETMGGSMVQESNQSTSLIETLKRAFLAMDRRDLIDKIRPGMNVESFRRAYDV